jgi:hypothetical protein
MKKFIIILSCLIVFTFANAADGTILFARKFLAPAGISSFTMTLPVAFTANPVAIVTMAVPALGGTDANIHVISSNSTSNNTVFVVLSGAPSLSDIELNLMIIGN